MSTRPHATGSIVQPVSRAVRGAGVLVAVAFVQLALSLRFFAEYVGSWAWPAVYGLYVLGGVAVALVIVGASRVRRLVASGWTLGLALVSLVVLDAVAYPKADALREVGLGSDQDDCARRMVHNVFAGREPFAEGYFGDPCSTGPSELFVYFPVQVWNGWFVVLPALVVLLGHAMLRVVVDAQTAVLLSLTQFASWMFLELSAVGSDLLVIGWMFGVAVGASYLGLRDARRGLLLSGTAAYVFVAGSRLPLAVVVLGSLVLLLVTFGPRALRIVVPVVLGTALLYLGSYAMAPDHFRPGHLVTKSLNIMRYLGGGSVLPSLLVLALLGVAVVGLALRLDARGSVRRHFHLVHVLLMFLPLVAVAVWDLLRRGVDVGEWEAWHYLWLCVPVLLVTAAHHLTTRSRPPSEAPAPVGG
jgi:hypothetical protein